MMMSKIYVQSYFPGKNISMNSYPWESNLPLIFFKKGIQKVYNKAEDILRINDSTIIKITTTFYCHSQLLLQHVVYCRWKAFDKFKKVIEIELPLAYPDFNKPFHICTDASDYQLDAVILQDEISIAFSLRKLIAAQQRYKSLQTIRKNKLFWINMDELKIHEEEVFMFLSESECSNIKFNMHTVLIFMG